MSSEDGDECIIEVRGSGAIVARFIVSDGRSSEGLQFASEKAHPNPNAQSSSC